MNSSNDPRVAIILQCIAEVFGGTWYKLKDSDQLNSGSPPDDLDAFHFEEVAFVTLRIKITDKEMHRVETVGQLKNICLEKIRRAA